MDEQRRPRSREKKVVNEGKGVEKRGQGLGTGPVNNTGNYEDRRIQQNTGTSPSFGGNRQNSGNGGFGSQQSNTGNPFASKRPVQGQGEASSPFGQNRQTARPGDPFSSRRPVSGTGNPFGNTEHKTVNSSGSSPRQYNSATKQTGSGMHRSSGSGSGGKMILIIIALIVLLGGGKLGGLFGGEDSGYTSIPQQTGSSVSGQQTTGSSTEGIGNLLQSLLGSGTTTAYDLNDTAGLFSAVGNSGAVPASGSPAGQYFTTESSDNSSVPDESVSKKARDKYTVLRGNNRDTVTILVYMCGTDLESQQGMATSDLKEMANATIGQNINLIVYTGGCSRWRNNVISSRTNQIYRISNGKFECLEDNAGNASMVNPETLVSFIQYGKKNYDADRMCLIFWDHGGGSVSGFGYDEKVGHNQSMTLAGINSALKKANVKFDFIGFDACLMATVENGLMLGQYADYMIASEETEPGVGWYYTNWLTKLSRNTSMPTIEIGKMIADDFVEVCNRQCRGQATTLSVVDLAELQATVPEELKQFSIGTNDLIQNKEYKKVSSARSKTREFAQQTKIDQIDLVDFARHLGTSEGKTLAKALQGAVKYNRTGGNISSAHGLSIYFPYKRASKVNQMVSTYQAIGMDEEYTRCIQEFASLEVCGQVSAGTSLNGYGSGNSASSSLLGSLFGSGNNGYTPYTQSGLEELLGGMYGSSGSTGSILDLFMGRSMTADKAAGYIMENHFDPSMLYWQDKKIILPDNQWNMITDVVKNVFYDDGSGFIDLGCDAEFDLNGNILTDNFDGTWISIDRQPVAYYYLNTVEDGDNYVISGYVPAILNGERVNLILLFDSERPEGYISGAQKVYNDGESDAQAKMLISIGRGDRIQFLCDYYDYEGNYRDSYKLGEPVTLGDSTEIANTPISSDKCRVTYRFTDLYQQHYWTPAV